MPEITAEEKSWLDKFRAEAQRFRDAYETLMSTEPVATEVPQLETEFNALYATGEQIHATVEWITDKVDAVTGWFSSAFGGARHQSLGVTFLIPVAAIAGAVAMMGKWIKDVYLFERKVEEFQRLESEHGSQRAADLLARTTGGSLPEAARALAKPIGVGLLAWAGWNIYQSMRSSR